MKKGLALVLSLCLLVLGAGCGSSSTPEKKSGKLPVSVSFYAMKELVQAVGGDKVEITTIIPDGTEPHDFQPTPKDMTRLHEAKVFVKQGLGMEPWADDMVKAADNPKLLVVEAAKNVTPIKNTDEDEIKEHGQYDPHAWLSLACARNEVDQIVEGLSKADPANGDYYKKNGEAYEKKLQDLENTYKGKFQNLPRKEFVTGHAAFAYLCRDFGLTQNSVESVFASGEPNAKQMAQLVSYCKEHRVTTIFTEAAISPKTSEALAKEVGAKVVPIHTLEDSEGSDKGYLALMEENLKAIYASLQ